MSLLDLQAVLQSQVASDHAISVGETTLKAAHLVPATDFDVILRGCLKLAGDLSVAVNGDIPAPTGSELAVTGTATLLNTASFDTLVLFTLEDDGTVDVLIVASLPYEWTFSTSFPALNTVPFTDLALTQPTFLATTAKQASYVWDDRSAALALHQGLNFAAFLSLSGPAAILRDLVSSLLPSDTIVLAGTIDPSRIDLATGLPPMALIGTIQGAVTAKTSFDLSLPEVLLISQTDENGLLVYRVCFASTLSVDNVPFSTFQASLIVGSPNISLSMLPTTNSITQKQISSLIGNVEFTQYIPSVLTDVFSNVVLTSLGAAFNVKTSQVVMLSGGIGTAAPWTMGDFTLKSMMLNCIVMSPFGPTKSVQVNFSATSSIFPDVFKGDFVFEITADTTGDLEIAANFIGKANLEDLVNAISNHTVDLPDSLRQIEFDDFGMSFTRNGSGGYDWQIHGAAQGTFALNLETGPLDISVQVLIQSTDEKKSYQLVGGLQIGTQFFDVEIDVGTTKKLTANWTARGRPLEFADVAAAFQCDSLAIPSDLDLALVGASLIYDFTTASLAFGAQSKNYGNVTFVTLKTGQPSEQVRHYVFCLAANRTFSLSNLPLVGDELAKTESVSVTNLQVRVADAPITDPASVSSINALIQSLGPAYPGLPATGLANTVVASADLQMGKDTVSFLINLGGSSPASAADLAPPGGTGDVIWFNVQRSFGPVSIGRIGVRYQPEEQVLWFELDATLAFGPLSLSLVGLGIGSPLSTFAPEFSLQGLGVAYTKPPLEIAGTLVNLAPPGAGYIEFEGGVVVSTSKLTLEAFGYYGNKSGFSSMFLFGDLAYPIGGPPAFFVTGAALGFGYNSNLRLPTIDQVHAFPFVQVLPSSTTPDTGLFGPNPTPSKVLDVIMSTQPPWVTPEAGSLWFGAGITFTSFELVNSQAMVFVETGDDLVIALIGDSRAQFPQQTGQGGSLYANIELDLEIRFAPEEGVFSAQAVLAPSSFLIDRACMLTGGFAFFVWYGDNPHAGDFVVTLGGYNPGFTAPAHYPAVPAVGFHWTMDSSITISGNAYFAMTPSVMMVGGRLDATYQAGNLKAWFDAHADVVVHWKPFSFDALIGITIGAAYKIDLELTTAVVSIELGCDLEFWGPPTGGTVTADWSVISFTIPFGSAKSSGQAIKGWSDVEAMLPNAGSGATPNVLSLTPTAGLTPSGASGPGPQTLPRRAMADAAAPDPPADASWRVRGGQLAFTAATPIPATTVSVGSAHAFYGRTFDVGPLGWTGISSNLVVSLTNKGNDDVSAQFEVAPLRKPVARSLWATLPQSGGRPQVPAGDNQLVADQIVGLSLEVRAPQIGASAGAVDAELALASVDLKLPDALLPLKGTAQPEGDAPASSSRTVSMIADPVTGIGSSAAVTARNRIFASLGALGYAPEAANDEMTGFAANAGSLFAAEPLLVA